MKKRYNFTKRKYGQRSLFATFLYIFLSVIIGIVLYTILGAYIEYNPPKITLSSNKISHKNEKIYINISDFGSGIKEYKISYSLNNREFLLEHKILPVPSKQIGYILDSKKLQYAEGNIKLKIHAKDNSNWKLTGNSLAQEYSLQVDYTKPVIEIRNYSYSISKGGIATIVVKVFDANLQSVFAKINNSMTIPMQSLPKKHYYSATVPWPMNTKSIDSVQIIANDNMKHITSADIALHNNTELSQTAFISLNTNNNTELNKLFLKINQLAHYNRTNNKLLLDDFSMNTNYLDSQYEQNQTISIQVANDGKVIFNDYVPNLGNLLAIDHGMGIVSLYCNLDKIDVGLNAIVSKNQTIGLLLPRHQGDIKYKFGILVNGYESDIFRWSSKEWIAKRYEPLFLEQVNQ